MTDSRQDQVLVDRDGAVALVTINRPSSHNALNAFVRRELPRALDELCRDGETRVIVLRGAGRRAFASGADRRRRPQVAPRFESSAPRVL